MKVVSKVVSKILYILREGSQGNRRFPAKVVSKILYILREGSQGSEPEGLNPWAPAAP